MRQSDLKSFLDEKVDQFNRPDFIENDPIQIPHQFSRREDIEIAGFFTAVLAWGQRATIINKSKQLMTLMDDAPFEFMVNHNDVDLNRFDFFTHRTFNNTDCLYFIHVLSKLYRSGRSLEDLFLPDENAAHIESGLVRFHQLFFSEEDFPKRTKKHIATPARNSACKRLNMFLRWMVRTDSKGVDFGIWERISPAQLICPCDLHVERVARKLRLIIRKQLDWNAALELTANLRLFDQDDPVKYDFALFGLGVEEKY
ncbi:MAG: TIGR02757 family protein [Cyclobacteriaceae bacterium]